MDPINPYVGENELRNNIILCKPHGSLTLIRQDPENGTSVRILEDPMEENQYDYCESKKATIQPGIIAPVSYKSEIIFPEAQYKVPSFYLLLSSQWKNLLYKLSIADELVIMGYRFPPEDLHLNFIVANAMAKRTNTKWESRKIRIYQRRSSNNTVKDNIKELFEVEKDTVFVNEGRIKKKL